MRHTAVIADDHPIVRQGLRQILEGIGAIDIVAEASNGLETIRHTKTLRPDLLILDIAMPYSKGLEVYLEVKRWSPETKVVIFTGLTSQGLLSQIIQTDINGLLLKRGDGSELQAAIPKVLGGQRVISTELSGMAAAEPALDSLTNREIQILSLIANGHNNSHIARMLNISPKTVDNHRTNIMRKLDVHSVAELMAYALREGILDAVRQL